MIHNLHRLLTRVLCHDKALVLLIAVGVATTGSQFTQAEGFESLHNGRDLEGWDGNPAIWSVQEGTITGVTTAAKPIEHNTFLIWQGKPLADFRLELQYRITSGNSGIQYRSRVIDPKQWIVGGYQADIEAGVKYSGILYEEQGRGVLTMRGEKTTLSADGQRETTTVTDSEKLQQHIRQGDWNDYAIEARGPLLKHIINNHLMSETHDNETEKRSAEGVLALQVHAGPPMKVEFRNIRLKRFDD